MRLILNYYFKLFSGHQFNRTLCDFSNLLIIAYRKDLIL